MFALVWGGAMMINFLWPASQAGANALRIYSNPKAVETDYYGTGQLVNFHIGFLNHIPLIELWIGVVVIVGAIYYFTAQRSKPWEPVSPPDEDLTGITSAR